MGSAAGDSDVVNPLFLPMGETSLHSECDVELNTYDRINFFLTNCSPLNATERANMLAVVQEIQKEFQKDAILDAHFLVPLLALYMTMILFGASGSGLVIYVVARSRTMRLSPRNLFIVNLAVSDLTLCMTQPFNLLRLLYAHQEWVLGEAMCKLIGIFQGTNIFVSTISITAIALDRFQVIIYPTQDTTRTIGAFKALLCIWIVSLMMASPLVVFSTVTASPTLQCTESASNDTIRRIKITYAFVSLVVQYIAPLIIVTLAYTRICMRINYRMINKQNQSQTNMPSTASAVRNPSTTTAAVDSALTCPLVSKKSVSKEDISSVSLLPTSTNASPNHVPVNNQTPTGQAVNLARQRKRETDKRRQRRTNILLASIAIVFALSWLPLNIFNIIMDFKEQNFRPKSMLMPTGGLAPPMGFPGPPPFGQFPSSSGAASLPSLPQHNMSAFPEEYPPLPPLPPLPSGNASIAGLFGRTNNFTHPQTVNEAPTTGGDMGLGVRQIIIIQALCLLAVLSSACTNPLLYGWLNENFKQEFKKIFCCFKTNKNNKSVELPLQSRVRSKINGLAVHNSENNNSFKPNDCIKQNHTYKLETNDKTDVVYAKVPVILLTLEKSNDDQTGDQH